MKKLFFWLLSICLALAVAGGLWLRQPILAEGQAPVDFAIVPGSGVFASAQQIADAGAPLNPVLFAMLARGSGEGARIKAGSYRLKPDTTPLRLLRQLVRGEFAQESLTIVEGWTFRQMRQAVAAHPALKHDSVALPDDALMARLAPAAATGAKAALPVDRTTGSTPASAVATPVTAADAQAAVLQGAAQNGAARFPEGLFFPDTYLFAKGASDFQVYRQAFDLMSKRLADAWNRRDPALPYRSPYEVLIMASMVEKETGKPSERSLIAGVFTNRLRTGMPLQTDPTVIYGLGDHYRGAIYKSDLTTDTAYNTYTRRGMPPTPIALPGAASLAAAVNPARTDALYFVARGDGSSYFSSSLGEHNQAVNRYQR